MDTYLEQETKMNNDFITEALTPIKEGKFYDDESGTEKVVAKVVSKEVKKALADLSKEVNKLTISFSKKYKKYFTEVAEYEAVDPIEELKLISDQFKGGIDNLRDYF